MSLSPAAQKIADAAVLHFAEKGYDAASLNTIAEAVGIRKATIYSHFKNKDEIFLTIFHEAVAVESAFAEHCFMADTVTGERYLADVAARYTASAHLRFLLRTAFIAPLTMKAAVSSGYEAFLQRIGDAFRCRFSAPQQTQQLFCEAYLGIADSIHVELIYASQAAAERRSRALWQLFILARERDAH